CPGACGTVLGNRGERLSVGGEGQGLDRPRVAVEDDPRFARHSGGGFPEPQGAVLAAAGDVFTVRGKRDGVDRPLAAAQKPRTLHRSIGNVEQGDLTGGGAGRQEVPFRGESEGAEFVAGFSEQCLFGWSSAADIPDAAGAVAASGGQPFPVGT